MVWEWKRKPDGVVNSSDAIRLFVKRCFRFRWMEQCGNFCLDVGGGRFPTFDMVGRQ
jgi:hypothetical protein